MRAAPSQPPRAAAPPVGRIAWNRRSAAPDAMSTGVWGGKSPGLAVLLAAGQRQHRRRPPAAQARLASRQILIFGAVFKSRNIPEQTLSQHQLQARLRLQRTHSCAASTAAINLLLSLTSRSISNLQKQVRGKGGRHVAGTCSYQAPAAAQSACKTNTLEAIIQMKMRATRRRTVSRAVEAARSPRIVAGPSACTFENVNTSSHTAALRAL